MRGVSNHEATAEATRIPVNRKTRRLIAGHRQRDHRTQRHPAKMPAARRPGVGERGKGKHAGASSRQSSAAPVPSHPGRRDQQHAAADPGDRAGLPDQPDQGAQPRRLDGGAREHFGFAQHAVDQRHRDRGQAPNIAAECRASDSLHTDCMVLLPDCWRSVNTVVYGVSQAGKHDRSISAKDWLDQGLKTLAEERLHGAEGRAAGEGDGGVARQFLLAFRRHRRVPRRDPEALARRRRRADHRQCRGCLRARKSAGAAAAPGVRREADAGEGGPRAWATSIPAARAAVQAIDRRRLGYVESLFSNPDCPSEPRRARAQIFYWAFLGFALSDQPLPKARQQAVLEELLRMASR